MTALGASVAKRTDGRFFYLGMATAFLLIAFGGFLPTYWLPVIAGSFDRPPIIHIHGMIFFLWTLYYFAQTALVATGRTPDHRSWGLAGIALFSVMICSVLAAQIAILKLNEQLGYGEQARRFAAVSLSALPVFVGTFALAIANVRRPEIHKRLMILLMAMLMQPAIARVFITLLAPAGASAGPPPPTFVAVPPGVVADLLIVAAMIHDWRTRGRPHAVYGFGLPVVLANQLIMIPISASAGWMAFTEAFEHLLG